MSENNSSSASSDARTASTTEPALSANDAPSAGPRTSARTAASPRVSRAALLALLAMLLLPLALCAPLCVVGRGPTVAPNTVLELDFDEPLDEQSSPGPLGLLAIEGMTLIDALGAIEKAKTDPRVKGIVARVGSGQSLATVQELREAIASFRASGKAAIAWTDTFGETAPGVSAYVLASAFDEIWLQPSGDVFLNGLFSEGIFLKGLLDKIGVEPQFSGRKEYKNAVNQFTETTYTEPHRTSMEALLSSLTDQIVEDLATSRPRLGDKVNVRKLLEGGPLTAQEALDRGLVDKLGYRDEVMAAVTARFGADAERMYLARYVAQDGDAWSDEGEGGVVALILASGQVARGSDSIDPISGGRTFGSDSTSAAIRAAVRDDDVRAILLRVDSPGGSYIASDAIRRELERARTAGKRIVVSMGDLAASGGYFVSMEADRIVANRATITGSIGVFAGKFVLKGLFEKMGVAIEPVAASSDVDTTLFSSSSGYSVKAREQLETMLDRIYGDFTTKAAAGRRMSIDTLEPLARGRIWTGADAKTHGLVDELGGFLRAIDVVRSVAGLPENEPVRLRVYPSPRPIVEQVLAALRGDEGDNSDDVAASLPRLESPVVLRVLRVLAGELTGAQTNVLGSPRPRVPGVLSTGVRTEVTP